MIKRIKLTPAMPLEYPLSSAVTIKIKNGETYYERVNIPRGNDIQTPLMKREKREKFFSNMAFSKGINKEQVEKVLYMLERLEEIKDISEIIRLLVVS